MGRRCSSLAIGKRAPYVIAEIKRMQLAGEPSTPWETSKIVRKKHRKGQWPNVEYFDTVEVIRETKSI